VAAATSTAASAAASQPASFKLIGVLLAVGSGLFIGSSFVFKKKVSKEPHEGRDSLLLTRTCDGTVRWAYADASVRALRRGC
jgi:hypothetical protein